MKDDQLQRLSPTETSNRRRQLLPNKCATLDAEKCPNVRHHHPVWQTPVARFTGLIPPSKPDSFQLADYSSRNLLCSPTETLERLVWPRATKSRLQNITPRCLLSGTWPSICRTSAAAVVLRAIRKERQVSAECPERVLETGSSEYELGRTPCRSLEFPIVP